MIDLHCHILPGVDDGAPDLAVSLAMGRAFVADGVTAVACTSHILPGVYPNSGASLRKATADLQRYFDEEGIALRLLTGADNHVVPNFSAELKRGHLLPLAQSRYVLVEPPHHILPPRTEDLFFSVLVSGYVPILTHPERMSWIEAHYAMIQRLVKAGTWMQITAGSLAGAFGRRARYWGERMLDDGLVHLIATDAHGMDGRAPNLGLGRDLAAKRVGEREAQHLVLTRPQGIVRDLPPAALPAPKSDVVTPGILYSKRETHGDLPNVAHSGDGNDGRADDGGLFGRLRRLLK